MKLLALMVKLLTCSAFGAVSLLVYLCRTGQVTYQLSAVNYRTIPSPSLSYLNSSNNTLGSSLREIVSNDFLKDPPLSSVISDRYPSTDDKIWIRVDTNTVLRRTAYYDTRPHFRRSIVIISLHDDEKEKKFPSLFGKVTMSNGATFCSSIQDWKTNGGIMKRWNDVVLTHILRISLDNHPNSKPIQVQVTKDSNCSESKLLPVMKVFYDQRNGTIFATCIQKALYGTIAPGDLINFIELNKLLGASYITVYFSNNLKNGDELLKAVSPYIETGLIEILDWKLTHIKAFDLAMSASATECVYRNIHRARYMALHDIDEYLVPRKHLTWDKFMDDLKTQTDISKYASFSFANILYKLDIEPVKQLQTADFNSTTQQQCTPPVYFTRQMRNGNPERGHPKVMLDLSTTITAYCHDIKNWKDGLQKQYLVPTDTGMLHHYRVITKGRTNRVKWVHDNTMDRYIDHIIPNIKKHCINR